MRRTTALALSLLAPPRCGICRQGSGLTQPACEACVAALNRAPGAHRRVPGLDQVFSALAYQREARELITALKFRRLAPLARVAATVIATKAPAGLLDSPGLPEVAIVPVPASPARLRARGLDPAEEIARALGRLTESRVERCLGREEAIRQVGRARHERLGDPPRFFTVAEPPAMALLIDDVLTTGATLGASGQALREAGSRRVVGVTFASTERRLPPTPGPGGREIRG